MKNIDFPSNGKGAFLYAARFCDNDVVLAGGSGTNSAKAINHVENKVIHVYSSSLIKWSDY